MNSGQTERDLTLAGSAPRRDARSGDQAHRRGMLIPAACPAPVGLLVMEMRERHVGPITTRAGDDGSTVKVDAGALVRRLLLFEHCTLESDNLAEIPRLVTVFGFRGLMELLESGALSIICDYISMGNIGQTLGLKITRARGRTLPLCSYRIVPVSIPERLDTGEPYREKYVDQALNVVRNLGLKDGDRRRLMGVLAPMLGAYPRAVVDDSAAGFRALVERQDTSIAKAVEVEFRKARDADLPGAVELRLDDIGNDGDFRVTTNLASSARTNEEDAHKIIERALLGAAALDQRFLVMGATGSVSGFREDELPVVETRFPAAWTWREQGGEAQEARFQRVVTIGGLPDLSNLPSGQEINIRRVLKLRDSADCREMRKWLREIDSESDAEISERLFSFREGLAAATHTRSKSVVRFVLITVAGWLPLVGLPAGVAATATDHLIFEKLIGRPGPATFLGHSYSSIFRRSRKHGIPSDE